MLNVKYLRYIPFFPVGALPSDIATKSRANSGQCRGDLTLFGQHRSTAVNRCAGGGGGEAEGGEGGGGGEAGGGGGEVGVGEAGEGRC